MDSETAARLLTAAGGLMLLAGCLFGFSLGWTYGALAWVGAFGCAVAAGNFRNRKEK